MTAPTPDLAAKQPAPHDPAARRTRLREFQTQLVERMQAASSGAVAQASQLAVMVGQMRWLLNLQDAGEIVPVGAITKVPLTKDWFLGMANVRGNLLTVVDLRRFVGLPAVEPHRGQRVLVLNSSRVPAGFLVDEVAGHRQFAPNEQRHGEAARDEALAPYLLGAFVRDGQPWLAMSLQKIVQSPTLRQAGL